MKLSIIIPAYNEEATIEKLIGLVEKSDTRDVEKEIIAVDDGSSDRTLDILKNMKNIKLVSHKKNKGKGAAIRTGINHATGEIIIIQDADLEYDPGDYLKLIKPITDNKTKVVYGSRHLYREQERQLKDFLKTHKSYWAFHLGGRLLTSLTNILYNSNITDEPTCYKVFDAGLLKSLDLKCKRFEFCPEVTAKVLRNGHKITEIPIPYHARSFKEGKKISWKDGVQAAWTLLKYRIIK